MCCARFFRTWRDGWLVVHGRYGRFLFHRRFDWYGGFVHRHGRLVHRHGRDSDDGDRRLDGEGWLDRDGRFVFDGRFDRDGRFVLDGRLERNGRRVFFYRWRDRHGRQQPGHWRHDR